MTTTDLIAALDDDVSEWFDQGRCVQADADAYFARAGETAPSEREVQAKAICARCPVLAECLSWALSVGDLTGVWAGGTSTAERLATQRGYDVAG